MMQGEFKISQGGEVIDVVKNTITNNGKKLIMQHLGRMRDGWGETMAFGTDGTGALSSNEWLGNEVYRCPIHVSKVDTTNSTITLRAVIDTDAQFRFKEMGIYPSTMFVEGQDKQGELITQFT